MTPEPLPFTGPRGEGISAYRYGSGEAGLIVAPGILAHQKLPEITRLAEELSARLSVYTLDFPGHGESGGRFSMGRREHLVLEKLLRVARTRHPRVAIVGFSFGGFHAAIVASRARVDALVLVSTPAHLRVWDHFPFGRAYFRTLPRILKRRRGRIRLGVAWPRQNPIDVIHLVKAPVLVLHGTDDWIVSARHADLLFGRLTGPKEKEIIAGGLHAEYLLAQDPDRFRARVQAFAEAHLT